MAEQNKELQKKAPTILEYVENLSKDVMREIEAKKSTGLVLPKSYAVQNALTSALFKIKETVDRDKKLALSVCTPDSVKQALVDMAVKGLDPAKTQCYFIVYGNKLTMFESYFGIIHRAKQSDQTIASIHAEVVYAKDKLAYSIGHGTKHITVHEQDPDNVDLKNIKGAYATILYKDGTDSSEYMSWQQILNSWTKSQTKGDSSTHKLHPEEMAKRTVLKRLVKSVVNTANDSQLLADVDDIEDQQDEAEATEAIDITPPDVEYGQSVDIPDAEPEPEPPAPAQKKPAEKAKPIEQEQSFLDELPDILK